MGRRCVQAEEAEELFAQWAAGVIKQPELRTHLQRVSDDHGLARRDVRMTHSDMISITLGLGPPVFCTSTETPPSE
jgi:hypothetical protein